MYPAQSRVLYPCMMLPWMATKLGVGDTEGKDLGLSKWYKATQKLSSQTTSHYLSPASLRKAVKALQEAVSDTLLSTGTGDGCKPTMTWFTILSKVFLVGSSC